MRFVLTLGLCVFNIYIQHDMRNRSMPKRSGFGRNKKMATMSTHKLRWNASTFRKQIFWLNKQTNNRVHTTAQPDDDKSERNGKWTTRRSNVVRLLITTMCTLFGVYLSFVPGPRRVRVHPANLFRNSDAEQFIFIENFFGSVEYLLRSRCVNVTETLLCIFGWRWLALAVQSQYFYTHAHTCNNPNIR